MISITDDILDALTDAARNASSNAHVPYSRFPVGAALLVDDGDIYVGCNVENASFGLTNCAERSALFSAVADGAERGDFLALLIYTPGDKPYPPCGACRQVLSEFLLPETRVYSMCETGEMVAWSMERLLPDAFAMPETETEKGD